MKRRDFVTAAGAMGLGLALSRRARAQPPTVFRLAISSTRSSPGAIAAVTFAKVIAARFGDRMRVEIYPAGELGGEVENFEDVRSGALDMTTVSSAGYAREDAALGVFDMPFLFRDAAHARSVLDGAPGQQVLKRMESSGVVGLGWAENGFRHITSADSPVRTPADLRGVRIRTPQSDLFLTTFRALGADAQPLPYPELYGALASGQFQAQDNPIGNVLSGGFNQVQKYLSLTGHIYSAVAILMSKHAFETLLPNEREAVRQAAVESGRASREAADQAEKAGIGELRRLGMTVIEDVDRAAFATALKSLDPKFEQLFGRDLIGAVRAFRS